jgi:hypothetical protein
MTERAEISGTDTVASAGVASTLDLVRWTGSLPQSAGQTVEMNFSIYQDAAGGLALWSESQLVKVGADGSYTVLLGVTSADGLPPALFQTGVARWIESLPVTALQSESAGDALSVIAPARTMLTAVPYALKSLDAETLAGRGAADYVTQEEMKTAVSTGARPGTQLTAEDSATPVVGAGTANYLPVWTDAATLGTSMIAESGANVGVGTATPASTLDVNGASTLRGDVSLPASAATASSGANSPALQLGASSYSSSGGVAVAQNFEWQAASAGNNSTTPTASLDLLFGSGSALPAPTGLSIAPNGQITFAIGQTFPSLAGGTITGVTPGTGLTGGGSSGDVSLSVDANVVPTLAASNTFGGTTNTFTGGVAVQGPAAFASSSTFTGATNTFANSVAFQSPVTFASTQIFPGAGTACPGIVNDGKTNNLAALQACMNTGGQYVLPTACQGNRGAVAINGTLTMWQPGSSLQGGGWGMYAACPTTLTQLSTTSDTIDIQCANSSRGYCISMSVGNMNITSSSATSGNAINFTGPNSYNGDQVFVDKVLVTGHARGILSSGFGNGRIGTVYIYSATTSAGLYLVDLGSGDTNSWVIDKLEGYSYNMGAASNAYGLLRFRSGIGNKAYVGDSSGFTNPVAIGVSGTSISASEVWLGDLEQATGPLVIVGTNSQAAVHWLGVEVALTNSTSSPFVMNGYGALTLYNPPGTYVDPVTAFPLVTKQTGDMVSVVGGNFPLTSNANMGGMLQDENGEHFSGATRCDEVSDDRIPVPNQFNRGRCFFVAARASSNQSDQLLFYYRNAAGNYVSSGNLLAQVSGGSPGAGSFALSNSGSITVNSGATAGNTSTIIITPVGGAPGTVSLSCAVAGPTGATGPATCSVPPSITVSGTTAQVAKLTVNSTAGTTGGAYAVTVTGTAGTNTESTAVTVNVNGTVANSGSFALSNSGEIAINPGATTGNTSTIIITPVGGAPGTVSLSCAVAGPTGAISPATCSVPSSITVSGTTAQVANLTVNSTSGTTGGAYAVMVTGTAGSNTESTVATVNVNSTVANSGSFALSNSGSITVNPGSTTGNNSTIIITPVGGAPGTVSLSCAVAGPTGATSPATCSVPSSITVIGTTAQIANLTVGTTSGTTGRAYAVTVTGTAGSNTESTVVTVDVNSTIANSGSFALSNSGDIAINPGATTGNTSTIIITPVGGAPGTVSLSCAVAGPTGATSPATCSVPSSITARGTMAQVANLTVNSTAGTTGGAYTVTVIGTAGNNTESTVVTVNINSTVATSGSFALSNSGTITVNPGATTGNSALIAITPVGGFTGTVSLSCTVTGPVGAASPPTCGVPTSVSVSDGTAQTATLTVITTAGSTSSFYRQNRLFWPSTGGAALAIVLLFRLPTRRRRWLLMLGEMGLVAVVAIAALGCGSGGNAGSSGGGSSIPSTTSGTYKVTVTGTEGSGASAISQTTSVTVTVNA